jgi:hypothetical protein
VINLVRGAWKVTRIHIYLYGGTFLVPTLGSIEGGGWLEIEPVQQTAGVDAEGLVTAITAAFNAGNPMVAATVRPSGKSVAVRYSGARTNRQFEQTAKTWAIEFRDGRTVVEFYRHFPHGRGWERIQGADQTTSGKDIRWAANRIAESATRSNPPQANGS